MAADELASSALVDPRHVVSLAHAVRSARSVLPLTLAMLFLAIFTSRQAIVSFELQVIHGQATLRIDNQTLHAVWPTGITKVVASDQVPYGRLFRLDGTDSSGTQSATSSSSVGRGLYEQFLCWLRDCADYSRWRDFSVRAERAPRPLLVSAGPSDLAQITLPAEFIMHGAFQRPDVSGSLTFFGHNVVTLTIDPDGRSLSFGSQQSYYPYDWRPYLAEAGWTLTRCYLWALILLAVVLASSVPLAGLSGWIGPGRLYSIPFRILVSRWPLQPLILTTALLATLLLISSNVYQRLPRIFDGVSYYFQGAILRSGHLAAPTPLLNYFPGPFMVATGNRWYSHFPPGTPLAIALGMLLHAPWVVEPFLGAVAALLMARLAARWYGRSTALLTLVALGLSPFYLFLASSYLSHMVALCALLLFLEGVDRLVVTRDWRWALLAGSGAGYTLLTRELALVLFALPVVIFYAVEAMPTLRRHLGMHGNLLDRRSQIMVAAFLTPLALCLAFYLFYDWRLTGQALLTPRAALDPHDTWGFGQGKGWNNLHTPAAGFFVLENQLTSLLTHLFGWPYYLTLSFFLLPLATLRLRPHDLLLYGLAATFLLGYAGYFYHGIAFGPRYLFESIPAYILLSARGVEEAAALTTAMLCRITAAYAARAGGVLATGLALLALCLCNLTYYLPSQFSLYYDYLEQKVDGGLAYERLHPSWMHHALVFSDDWAFYGDVLFALNDPLLRGDVLYASLPGSSNIGDLLTAYPQRSLYRLRIINRQLSFQPMPIGPASRQVVLRIKPAAKSGIATFSDLAMDTHGDLFVADATDGTIRHFDATGRQLGSFASGVAAGQPFALRSFGSGLYWLDPAGQSIWRADRAGRARQRILRCPCHADSSFALGPGGEIVLADPSSGLLRRYSAQGAFLSAAAPGTAPGPVAVVVSAEGSVLTYDRTLGSLVGYDAQLRRQRVISLGQQAPDALVRLTTAGTWLVALDPGGQQLVAYDLRTGARRTMAVTRTGDLVPAQSWGLVWNGRQLVMGGTQQEQVVVLPTGSRPF